MNVTINEILCFFDGFIVGSCNAGSTKKLLATACLHFIFTEEPRRYHVS